MISAHPNAATIERFYDAFKNRDANGMSACYHRDVHFSDEVFPNLRGAQAAAMWRMLCDRGRDLRIEVSDVEADDHSGRARWSAWYTFSATGRPVHNVVNARFEFRDGKIVRHRDDFSFWRWSRQALGPAGTVLGWTPLIKGRVRREAARGLERFIQRSDAQRS